MRGGGGLHSPYYFIGYETGFGGRKLIGSLFSLFLPDYVQHRHITPVVFMAFLLLAIMFVVLVCRTIKLKDMKSSPESRSILCFLAIYLISANSIFGFIGQCAGFIDVFLYLLTLAFVFIYIKYRGKWFYYFSTTLIVLAGCLTHHIFCCLFFPLFFALFINEVYSNNQLRVKEFVVYGIITLMLIILFCLIWFFSSPVDIDAVYEQVCSRTNGVCIKERIVFHWLYGSNHENYLSMWENGQFPLRYYQFLPVAVLMTPIIALFYSPWIMAIKNAEKGIQRRKYLLMFLAQNLLFLPIFVIATDYFRWWYAWFFCQIIMMLTMYKIKDYFFCSQMLVVFSLLKRNRILTLLLIIYICSISIGNCGVEWIDTAFSIL
jgi:hypothetical protein